MKPLNLLAFVAIAMAGVGPVRADPISYTIDTAHTRVYWETRHFGTSTHRGRFDRVQGHIALDRDAGTGISRRGAFVEMRTAADAQKAINGLNFADFDGRLMSVYKAVAAGIAH